MPRCGTCDGQRPARPRLCLTTRHPLTFLQEKAARPRENLSFALNKQLPAINARRIWSRLPGPLFQHCHRLPAALSHLSTSLLSFTEVAIEWHDACGQSVVARQQFRDSGPSGSGLRPRCEEYCTRFATAVTAGGTKNREKVSERCSYCSVAQTAGLHTAPWNGCPRNRSCKVFRLIASSNDRSGWRYHHGT